LTNNLGLYISPNDVREYIYSIDIHYHWFYEPPPLGKIEWQHQSSMEPERALVQSFVEDNARIFRKVMNEI
jgi:hypothetical protein